MGTTPPPASGGLTSDQIQEMIMTYAGSSIAYAPIVITSNTFTLAQTNDVVEVNKTTGSATAVPMPIMTVDHLYQVKDAKGDAASNNITITTANGDGKIDGQTSAVINTNFMSLTLVYDGATTKIV